MARSRVGGSSAKLSGVLGSLLFTVGKSADGGYEQYIASYSGQRENPRTKYQMLARMQIALVERMTFILSKIVRCSFEGIDIGVNSVNEFAKLNMKDIQSYCQNYWKEAYGWSFPTMGNPYNSWAPLVVSYGSLQVPKCWSFTATSSMYHTRRFDIQLPSGQTRFVDLRKALGLSFEGSFNIVLISGMYEELKTGGWLVKGQLNKAFGDTRNIDATNVATCFKISTERLESTYPSEERCRVQISFDAVNNKISILVVPESRGEYQWLTIETHLHALIYSDKKKSRWCKSTARLTPYKIFDPSEEYGLAPYLAYQTWDSDYSDQEYDEYFGR